MERIAVTIEEQSPISIDVKIVSKLDVFFASSWTQDTGWIGKGEHNTVSEAIEACISGDNWNVCDENGILIADQDIARFKHENHN